MNLTCGLSYAEGVQNVCDLTAKGMSWGKKTEGKNSKEWQKGKIKLRD